MDNSGIRYNSSLILRQSFKPLFLTFLVVLLANRILDIIPYLVGGVLSDILTIIISIITLTLSQGQVRAVLKAVRGNSDDIIPQVDGLAGLTGFIRYISTYLVTFVIYLLVAVLIILALFLLVTTTQVDLINTIQQYYNELTDINVLMDALVNDQVFINALNSIFMYVFGGIMVGLAAFLVVYLNIALAPYLLEKYDYRGLKAITMSYRFMKGNKRQLLLLILSFIGLILLTMLVSVTLAMIIPNSYLLNLLVGIVFILIFALRYNVALGIFFEEVDIRYEGQTHE